MKATRLDFRPFRAWRFNPSRVETSRVIAPPYDVISPAEQEALYRRSPHNVIRLILGKEPDFHDRSARLWLEWAGEGILVEDNRPAFYLYEQSFKHPFDSRPLSRTALVGTLKLEEPGAVFRHEATFDAPKRDRMLLLEKTRTNLSPIFGIYRDSTRLKPLFNSCRTTPLLSEAEDGQGVLHRLWALEKEEDQRLVRETLASERILIADGHHRYETALEYRRRMREKFPRAPEEAPFDFVMTALAAADDPGLLVLPTHRVIRSFARVGAIHELPLPTEREFLDRLQKHFEFIPQSDEKILPALETQPRDSRVLGLVLKSGNFLLRLKDLKDVLKFLPPGKPALWYEIEANLLTYFIFDGLGGLPAEKRRDFIQYTHSSGEAVQAVRTGKAEAAFLMRSAPVDTIRELAYAGERMPQKTTYFYPKLASGLVFYHHEDSV